jgi:hypothetical protein
VTGCLFRDNRIASASEFGDDLVKLLQSEAAAVVRKDCASCQQCWTNCESFPSMMNSPLRTLIHAARKVRDAVDMPQSVNVTSRQGVVTLKGGPMAKEEADRALAAVLAIPGVREVRNYLQLA